MWPRLLLFCYFLLFVEASSNITETFFKACKAGDNKAVKSLITAETVMALDAEGKTGLIMATENGHCELVRTLLKRKETDQDTRTKDGSSALIIATERNYYPCLVYLTKPGINANADLQRNDGWRALHFAAKFNRLQMAQILVETGKANLETRTDKDETPLIIASQHDSNDVAFYLLEKGADVGAVCWKVNARTALNYASEKGNFELVRRLIEKDAKLETGKDGTPLVLAVLNKQPDIALYLINRGANTNALDRASNHTLLYIAAKSGMAKLIEPLLTRGANPNWRDGEQNTPFLVAVANGHCADIAKQLARTNGVDVNAKQSDSSNAFILAASRNHLACIKMLAEVGVDKDAKRDDGETALHIAIENAINTAMVREIVQCRPDLGVKNSRGMTPFFKAVDQCKADVANYLAEHQPSLVDPLETVQGESLLMSAARCNLVTISKALIEKGADVNAISTADGNNKMTALMYASQKGYIEIARLLVEKGKADVNTKTSYANSKTALHFAVGHPDTVRFLLESGAEVEADGDEGTPLFYATFGNHTQAALLLIERGANVNAINRQTGDTPLINAARHGNQKVAEALLLRGADIKTKNRRQENALKVAKSKSMHGVAEFLQSKGALE